MKNRLSLWRGVVLVILALIALAAAGGVWEIRSLAEAASLSARNSQDLIQRASAAMREAFADSARAWVGPESARIRGTVIAGRPVVVDMTIQNTGREPAQDFAWRQQRFASATDQASAKNLEAQIAAYITKCIATPPAAGQAVLFPSVAASVVVATAFEGTAIDGDVVKGDKLLFVETCVSYTTGHKPRHSAFCHFYNAAYSNPQNLNLCQIGNFAD